MRRIMTVLLASIFLTAGASADDDAPKFWTKLPFDEAREKAKQDDRLLIAYATAVWCGPCKMMERTTWKSEDVGQWFDDYGVAIKVDVDDMPDLAEELGVYAMPTLVAFREGEMFDRTLGYQSEEALLEWLENVRAGRRIVDQIIEAAGERIGPDGRVNMRSRLELARQLSNMDAVKEATDEYLWLWDNMLDHQQSMYGVRLSFMIRDMQHLAHHHQGAMRTFLDRRAHYLPKIEEGTATSHEMADWISLAKVVDEEDSILQWFDTVNGDSKYHAFLQKGRHWFHDLLVEHDRWEDVARLYEQPVVSARQRVELRQTTDRFIDERFDAETREYLRATRARKDRDYLSQMYAALLAVDREDEAEQVAAILLAADDSPAARGALVTTALKAGQPRHRQMKWIEEAEKMGANVPRSRRELTRALEDIAR